MSFSRQNGQNLDKNLKRTIIDNDEFCIAAKF